MSSLNLPSVTDTAVTTVKELLAFATLPYYQVSGNLTKDETAVGIGDPIAWETSTGKWINYAQGGSNDETIPKGFVRIGCSAAEIAAADCPIEVVVGGAVKYSLVSAASAWHTDIIAGLYGRVIIAADAFIF